MYIYIAYTYTHTHIFIIRKERSTPTMHNPRHVGEEYEGYRGVSERKKVKGKTTE